MAVISSVALADVLNALLRTRIRHWIRARWLAGASAAGVVLIFATNAHIAFCKWYASSCSVTNQACFASAGSLHDAVNARLSAVRCIWIFTGQLTRYRVINAQNKILLVLAGALVAVHAALFRMPVESGVALADISHAVLGTSFRVHLFAG